MYNACYRLFGICPRTSRTPKFCHTYVITYGDFKVNVEPCIRDVKKWGGLGGLVLYTSWPQQVTIYIFNYPKTLSSGKGYIYA